MLQESCVPLLGRPCSTRLRVISILNFTIQYFIRVHFLGSSWISKLLILLQYSTLKDLLRKQTTRCNYVIKAMIILIKVYFSLNSRQGE